MHLLHLSASWCLLLLSTTLQWQLQPALSFAMLRVRVAPTAAAVTRNLGHTPAAFRHTGNNDLLAGSREERNNYGRISTRQQVLPPPVHADVLADSLLVLATSASVSASASATTSATTAATTIAAASTFEPSAAAPGLSPTTTVVVFIVGVIPYIWATIEFWRRIAVGASFGTGSDSVVFSIGEDDNPESSRGKQVLGKGALVIAYILFATAAAVLGLVLLSVITTGPLPLPAFESVQ
jgi:hypothetical protein